MAKGKPLRRLIEVQTRVLIRVSVEKCSPPPNRSPPMCVRLSGKAESLS
jgi:hypothetical protein